MSVSDGRISRLRVTVTVVIALILAVLPLPHWMDIARPYLLLLLVIYWSLSAPRIAGLLFAWLCGLAIDVLKGTTLGQHALAFLLVSFLTHKFQLRMRIFPLSQQTVTVLLLLLLYEFVCSGPTASSATRSRPGRAGSRCSPARCCGRCSSRSWTPGTGGTR